MKLVALISGGKDSTFNMMCCVANGHQIVALANLAPPASVDELDSYMYQSVGSSLIRAYEEVLGLPLFQREIVGSSACTTFNYEPCAADEVEDLYVLLKDIIAAVPGIEGVSVGAIFSDYQRVRVENVCHRLNLHCFAYLWHEEQAGLLKKMITSHMHCVIVKVAAMGLNESHLGCSIQDNNFVAELMRLAARYQLNVCGEGGEYESVTLDCPLFKRRIVLDAVEMVQLKDDPFAPVACLRINTFHTQPKDDCDLAQNFDFSSLIPPMISDLPQSCNRDLKACSIVEFSSIFSQIAQNMSAFTWQTVEFQADSAVFCKQQIENFLSVHFDKENQISKQCLLIVVSVGGLLGSKFQQILEGIADFFPIINRPALVSFTPQEQSDACVRLSFLILREESERCAISRSQSSCITYKEMPCFAGLRIGSLFSQNIAVSGTCPFFASSMIVGYSLGKYELQPSFEAQLKSIHYQFLVLKSHFLANTSVHLFLTDQGEKACEEINVARLFENCNVRIFHVESLQVPLGTVDVAIQIISIGA